MLYNAFTVALRNLLRQKGFTAINVAGLALGMAATPPATPEYLGFK